MAKKRKAPGKDAHWAKRLWYFIWYDDSLLSWIVNILLAFLLIKFIVYPGLGLIFGSQLPLVAVISESMEHNGNLQEWWGEPCDATTCPYTAGSWYEDNGITREEFAGYPLANGFNRGDVILLTGANSYERGDVIVFSSGKPYPIIHRIVDINSNTYVTKGDNNPEPISSFDLNELAVEEEQIIGVARVRIPWVGYLKLLFVDALSLIGVNA